MFWRICFTAILILSSWRPTPAQSVRHLTCEDAIRIALGDSYIVKYHHLDIEATRSSYLYTRAQFKPILSMNLATPSWDESMKEIMQADALPVYNSISSLRADAALDFTYVLPTSGTLSLSSRMYFENYKTSLASSSDYVLRKDQIYSRFALTFSQPIFTANALKENMRVAELNYQKSTHYFSRVQMDIVYDVTEYFYEVYKKTYEYRMNLERLENSREALRVEHLKHEAGNVPEGDLLIAEITVAQDEARVMESRNMRDVAKDKFKLLIGLELTDSIELQEQMDFEPFFIDLDVAIGEALHNRIELKENRIDIELQKIAERRARREGRIKGSIEAYYDLTGLSTQPTGSWGELVNSSFDNMKTRPHNRGISLNLSIPILDWGRAKNRVDQEIYRLQQSELDLEHLERAIEQSIREIVGTVHEATQRFVINQRNLEAAQQSFRITQRRFERGDMTSQELSIEQNRLAEIQSSYIDSYITYKLSVADLNRETMYDFQNNRSYRLEMDGQFNKEQL